MSGSRRIAALPAAILATTLLLACSGPKSANHTARLSPVEAERGSELGEDPDARTEWFLFQRSYPNGVIPADARRIAWERILESRRLARQQSELTPAAAPVWQASGPSPTLPYYSNIGVCSGRINAIAVSPANAGIVLVGGATGGIWRSADGGSSFTPVSDDQADLAVGFIAFSRSNPSIVYAGMGDTKIGYLGSGVLKSTNAGQSWTRISNGSLPSPGTISKVEVDPANPNRVYVAQYSKLNGSTVTSSGVYASTDGGVNWTRALAGAARDVVLDAGNSQTVFAALSRIDPDNDPPFGLYRSTDRGATWSPAFSAPQYDTRSRRDIRIAVTPANPQRLFVYFGGVIDAALDARFELSTDGGASWTEQTASGFDTAQLGYNTYIVADPNDASTLYLGSRDVYKSTNGGETWKNLTRSFSEGSGFYEYTPAIAKAHADQHSFAFSPAGSNQFFIGNDGGIWRSGDGGASFQSLNATLSLAQFTGVAVHPTDPSMSYGGTQDNGSQRRLQGSGKWLEFQPGDGGHTVIDPLNPSTVFVTYIRGNIYRFFNNGDSFDGQIAFDSTFGELGVPRMAFYPPFAGNKTDSTLYFGTWRLFTSTDLGNSWMAPAGNGDLTKGLTDKGADVLSAIGVSPSDTQVICTGSAMGRAMLSADGGFNWRDVTPGLPNRSITSMTFDPAAASTIYTTVSGFDSGHVFRTTDSGTTWTDLSSGLPNVPANAFLIDPVDPNTHYVGTDVGVFRSTDRGATWGEFNRGLPPVVIHEFSAQSSGLIQVATYGRGIYRIVANQRPAIASVEFNGKKKLTITGQLFGESPRVLINGEDRSSKITKASDTVIKLKGKRNKLGLQSGDNSIQVSSSDRLSGVFILRL